MRLFIAYIEIDCKGFNFSPRKYRKQRVCRNYSGATYPYFLSVHDPALEHILLRVSLQIDRCISRTTCFFPYKLTKNNKKNTTHNNKVVIFYQRRHLSKAKLIFYLCSQNSFFCSRINRGKLIPFGVRLVATCPYKIFHSM